MAEDYLIKSTKKLAYILMYKLSQVQYTWIFFYIVLKNLQSLNCDIIIVNEVGVTNIYFIWSEYWKNIV